jgi:hypothetical protein
VSCGVHSRRRAVEVDEEEEETLKGGYGRRCLALFNDFAVCFGVAKERQVDKMFYDVVDSCRGFLFSSLLLVLDVLKSVIELHFIKYVRYVIVMIE